MAGAPSALEAGDAVEILAVFDAPVYVDADAFATLSLTLRVDSAFGVAVPSACRRTALYVGGNGTSALAFAFVAREGDVAASLDADSRSALATAGWVRRRALPVATQDADLAVPLGSPTGVAVDGHRPAKVAAVVAVAPLPPRAGGAAVAGVGDEILIAVDFNRAVVASVGINHWSTAGPGYFQTPLPRPNRTRFP